MITLHHILTMADDDWDADDFVVPTLNVAGTSGATINANEEDDWMISRLLL